MFFEFFLVEPRYLDLVGREIAEFLDVIMGVRDKQVDGMCAPVLTSFRFLILSCMIKQRFCLRGRCFRITARRHRRGVQTTRFFLGHA